MMKEFTDITLKTINELLNVTPVEELPTGVRLIAVPGVTDSRGSLAFMEGDVHIPFPIARVFFLYDIPSGASRGDHSHRTCAEVVFAVHGAFTMAVDDGRHRMAVRMDRPDVGILIPPGIWCRLLDFAEGTVCAVMASEKYDASGYTYSYSEFQKESAT